LIRQIKDFVYVFRIGYFRMRRGKEGLREATLFIGIVVQGVETGSKI